MGGRMSQLLPRPIALAKLLALGPMNHFDLLLTCGWPIDEFSRVARDANKAGLITWAHKGRARWYCIGVSTRKKFAQNDNKRLKINKAQLHLLSVNWITNK